MINRTNFVNLWGVHNCTVFANGDTNHSLNSHPKMLRTHTLRTGFNSDKARQGPLGRYLK